MNPTNAAVRFHRAQAVGHCRQLAIHLAQANHAAGARLVRHRATLSQEPLVGKSLAKRHHSPGGSHQSHWQVRGVDGRFEPMADAGLVCLLFGVHGQPGGDPLPACLMRAWQTSLSASREVTADVLKPDWPGSARPSS